MFKYFKTWEEAYARAYAHKRFACDRSKPAEVYKERSTEILRHGIGPWVACCNARHSKRSSNQ